jgi:hypothetical protein
MSERFRNGHSSEPYLEQRVRDALAREEGELGITVSVTPHAIRLSGVVQTPARRARVELLCRRVGAGYEVENRIEVDPPTEAESAETLS